MVRRTKTKFAGFPRKTNEYLGKLAQNNNKVWFDAHKEDYEEHYLTPAKEFVDDLGARLAKLSPELRAEPRINGSILRVQRDTRFSLDKTPYKDHLAFLFWEGTRSSAMSTLFVSVSEHQFTVGAGYRRGTSPQLRAFREAIADKGRGQVLADVAKKLRKKGYELEGAHFKRHPRGFPEDGPASEFLLHDRLLITEDHPAKFANQEDVVAQCIRYWRSVLPLHRWLTDEVQWE